MLETQEVKELSQLNHPKMYLSLFYDWVLIVATFGVYAYVGSWWLLPLAVIMIARTQLALAILVHEASHKRLHQNVKWNDYIGQIFCAAPILFSMYSYRHNHMKHHRIPLEKEDPDITLTGGYPISKTSFVRKFIRDLFGISYFKFIKYFLYGSHGRSKKLREVNSNQTVRHDKMPKGLVLSSILVSNLLIFGILYLLGIPWGYFYLWLLPMWTILQVLLRVRGITEHAGYKPGKDQRLLSRTVINPLQTFFFAPHQVNYHIEHHEYVSVPYYNLPKVHEKMKERGSIPEANFYSGYGQVMRELVIS